MPTARFEREARGTRAARASVGHAAGLRSGAAQAQPRLHDRSARAAGRRARPPRRSLRCGSASTSSRSSTAAEHTRSWGRASSSRRPARAAGTSSSTPSCAARRASCRACPPTTRRAAPRSRTRTRSGSCTCGGRSSAARRARAAAPQQRARGVGTAREHARHERGELSAKLPVVTRPAASCPRDSSSTARSTPTRTSCGAPARSRRSHARRCRRAHARPATGRARARPVRGTRRQDDAHRGADGREGASSRSSATRVARRAGAHLPSACTQRT